MTKWVTLLLLLLAALSFGLSKLRPVPSSPESASTPATVSSSTTKAEEEVPDEAPPASTELSTSAPAGQTGNGASKKPRVEPKFGPPPGQVKPESESTPAAEGATAATKVSPRPERKVKGNIKAVTFSSSAMGDSRTKFPSSTGSIFLTATPEGLHDRVPVVARYRSVLDEKAEFSAPIASTGPPRRRSFELRPPEGGWKKGPYQVTLQVAKSDQSLSLQRFEVTDPEEKQASFPAPEYTDLVPDLEATSSKTTYFKDDEFILLRVSAQKLKPGTSVRSVWSAVEVDRLTTGELIAVSEQSSPQPGQDTIFRFDPPRGGFHTGSYKVDLYFEQQLMASQTFFIQEPQPKP